MFGTDDETIEKILMRLAAEKGWSLATAESATGGMVAARITSMPGASTFFRGAVVAYDTDVKREVLGVPDSVIDEHGVVSEPVASRHGGGCGPGARSPMLPSPSPDQQVPTRRSARWARW